MEQLKEGKGSLVDQVEAELENRIKESEVKPGDRLPSENELAALLNVSRPTIREAVKRLSAKGVLEIHRGVGTYVARHPGRMEDPLGIGYLNQDRMETAVDLLQVRLQLEPWMAEQAALHRSEKQMAKIEGYAARVEKMIDEGIRHYEMDRRLHTAIAEATGNEIMPLLIPIIDRSIFAATRVTDNTLIAETKLQHRQIVDAIRARDAKAARRYMENHINMNLQFVEQMVKEVGKFADSDS